VRRTLAPTSKLHDLHPVNPPPPADTQIPELGFSFTSDAIETSQSPFALLVTREVNGVYFDQAGAPGLGAAPAQVPLP